jgi:hypothetical protein
MMRRASVATLCVLGALAAIDGCGRIPLDLGAGASAGQGGTPGQSGSTGQSGGAGQSGSAGQGSSGQGGSAGQSGSEVPPIKSGVAVASDATGMKLVVVGGGIWTSTDGGTNWIDRAPSGLPHIQAWQAVASDSTGTNLVAVVSVFHDTPVDDPASYSGDVWTSTDSGATWNDNTTSGPAHGQEWTAVASDASGTRLIAGTKSLGTSGAPGAVWTSTDAGVTWTNRTAAQAGMGTQSWKTVASDAVGKNLVAGGPGSGIWASTDGGAAWTDRTPVDPNNIFQASFTNGVESWWSIASDVTGTHLVAAVASGDIWTSTDGGASWTDGGLRSWWSAVVSDSTGARLAAVGWLTEAYGYVLTSTNGGMTWNDETSHCARVNQWDAIASNANATHFVAITSNAICIYDTRVLPE